MQVNLTLFIQLINGLIAIFVVKRWLVLPYIAYYNRYQKIVESIVGKANDVTRVADEVNYQQLRLVESFQQQAMGQLKQAQFLAQVQNNQQLLAFKQEPKIVAERPAVQELNVKKILESLGDST